MLTEYKTVYEGGVGELIEKKSRFIANVRPVLKEEEAAAFIESMKKKYWNAAHNCYAYVIGERFEIQRCSDDGEPGNTAGKPILDVLLGEDVHNVAVVVTRYFGGTLLGTGGLVRAYGNAAKAGLSKSSIITKVYGQIVSIDMDYVGLGKVQYVLGQEGLTILDSDYTDRVVLKVLIPEEKIEATAALIIEATNGQSRVERECNCYFAEVGNVMSIFERFK